ncbi:hypothetical protein KRP22_002041 [Phytophthora ramorum]
MQRRQLRLLGVSVISQLVVAAPDLAIGVVEAHDAVDERLALRVGLGCAPHLREELPDHLEVRSLVKRLVKGQQRTRTGQRVARHLEFVHGVHCIIVNSQHKGQ